MSPVKSAVTPIYGTAFVDPVAAMVSSPIPTVPIVSMEPVVAVPAISIVTASEIRAMVLITAAVISCRGVRRRARRNPDPHQHANCQNTACYLRYQSVASHCHSLHLSTLFSHAIGIHKGCANHDSLPASQQSPGNDGFASLSAMLSSDPPSSGRIPLTQMVQESEALTLSVHLARGIAFVRLEGRATAEPLLPPKRGGGYHSQEHSAKQVIVRD